MSRISIVFYIILTAPIFLVSCGSKKSAPTTPQFRPPLEAACDAGEAPTCIKIGQTSEQKGDLDHAVTMFGKACDLGSSEGCLFAAGALLEGEPNTTDALKYLARGCDMKEPAACYGSAVVFTGVYGTPPDNKSAVPMFERACELGLTEGCGSAAMLKLELATDDTQREEALAAARSSCANGDAATCFALGMIESEKSNHAVAANMYKDACRLGDGVACRALALLYIDGKGVPQDDVQAHQMFEKGCLADVEDITSCAYYGFAKYQNAESDDERQVAKSILKGACEKRDAESCFRMALVEPGNMTWVEQACQLSPDDCERYTKATTVEPK